jgi:hypothetical protein
MINSITGSIYDENIRKIFIDWVAMGFNNPLTKYNYPIYYVIKMRFTPWMLIRKLFGFIVRDRILVIITDKPGVLIGLKGETFNKYRDILIKEVPNLKNVIIELCPDPNKLKEEIDARRGK